MLLLKCSTQYVSKFGKLSRGHKTGKGQFLSQPQRTAKSKNLQTTVQICSFTCYYRYGQNPWLQHCENWELPDVQAGFRKGRGTSDQIVNIHCIMEKQGNFREKKYISASLTMLKPLTGWTTTNCGKFLRDGNTIPPYQSPEKPVCRSRSNS